jgi:quercetin dioxygenase-like cupin family protein
MAFKNKVISNPFNKQTIKFLTTSKDSNGKLLEMISTWQPGGSRPVEHYHPNQDEYFTVIEGKLSLLLNGEHIVLSKGESLQIPRNAVHSMWNDTDAPVIAEWKVYPALKTEYLLEAGAGLAAEYGIHRRGTPRVLDSAFLLTEYSREFRIAKPSYPVQKVVLMALTPFTSLKSKKKMLAKYLD